ncbi:MAG: SPOR domain-containing protein [Arenicellales bacterium]
MRTLSIFLLRAGLCLLSANAFAEDAAIHRDNWYLSQPDEYATIQLSGHANEEAAIAYIKSSGLSGDTGYYQSLYKEQPWYAVTSGVFRNLVEARSHLKSLPADLQQHAPWPRTFITIKSLINAAKDLPDDNRPKETAEKNTASTSAARKEGQDNKGEEKHEVRKITSQERIMLRKAQSAFTRNQYMKSHDIWLPLAEAGIAEAQYSLGFLYQSGWAPERDLHKAVAWYTSAAEQNEARAQFNLGALLLNGEDDVEKDTETGILWIVRSAENNNARAKEFLIGIYSEGKYGFKKSKEKADYWKSR